MKSNQLTTGQKFRITSAPESVWQVYARYYDGKTKAICVSGPVLDRIVAMVRPADSTITIPKNSNVELA